MYKYYIEGFLWYLGVWFWIFLVCGIMTDWDVGLLMEFLGDIIQEKNNMKQYRNYVGQTFRRIGRKFSRNREKRRLVQLEFAARLSMKSIAKMPKYTKRRLSYYTEYCLFYYSYKEVI